MSVAVILAFRSASDALSLRAVNADDEEGPFSAVAALTVT